MKFGKPGEFISELLPAGLTKYGDIERYTKPLFNWQCDALPAIIAGWIEVDSDTLGRAVYSVTPDGEAAVKAAPPEPPQFALELADATRDQYDAMADLFWGEFSRERDRLLTVRPSRPNEIGPCPLSAGLWDETVGPWNYKPIRKSRKQTAKGNK